MSRLRPRSVVTLGGAFLLTAVTAVAPLRASAQDASPTAAVAMPPAGCEVAAPGLANPRHVTVGPDGTVYVAEAGAGGDLPDYATPGAGTPTAADPATTHGPTGRVTAIAPDGTSRVVVDGLPSYRFGEEVIGPSGVVFSNGTLYVAVGGPGGAVDDIAHTRYAASVIAVDPATGAVTEVADIGAFEVANNPDPNTVDSNIVGIAAGADGTLFVADGGGNTVYEIDPTTGDLSVLAVLPGLPTPAGAANPLRGGREEADPVPTGIVATADGGVDVGLLTGGIVWGTPGSASIVHVGPDGAVSTSVTGLNLVVGLAAAPDGTRYAAQLSENYLAETPAPGSVVRIAADGAVETIVPGLTLPYGVAVAPDGTLYVVENASAAFGAPAQGELLRCDVAAMTGDAATPAPASATPEAGSPETGSPEADTPEAAVPDGAITVSMVDLAFQPNTITIAADTDVTLTLRNDGVLPHSFIVDALGIKTGDLPSGHSETITIHAAAGTYPFYCGVPGHKDAGMIGTLVVA